MGRPVRAESHSQHMVGTSATLTLCVLVCSNLLKRSFQWLPGRHEGTPDVLITAYTLSSD